MASQRLDFSSEANGGKRMECLWDYLAGDELDQQILSCSQRLDPQTGLLNLKAFQDDLAVLLSSGPAVHDVALIWIDLVNLRREFSLWGWTKAEAFARRIASILRSVVDEDALLGRAGGQSFLVAMKVSKLDRTSRRRIQAVMDALTPPQQRNSDTRPEVATGVAFYPSDTASVEDLVRFACLAATRASFVKSQRVVAFHARMNNRIMRDHLLEVEMRKGLDLDQFCMFYQPKVDLITGHILGAEALIRWNHPKLGAIAPGEFIPVAEHSDLIERIFEFSLRTALEQAQHWRDLGLFVPIIAVNASAANLRADNCPRSVQNILAEIPIAPMQLELEMTESLAFEDEYLFVARVRQLKVIGIRVAIDDFGTRYTGFNVLKKLPLDTMKIDQCFIRGIDRSPDMLALCQTIVAMARHLRMRAVGEGIEELGELDALRRIGCEAGQGYLFQRPIPAEEFVDFLREWPERMHAFGFTDTPSLFDADPQYAAR